MHVGELPDWIGRYQTRAVVGVGAFASVVRAYDERLDADVAIKVLAADCAGDDEIRERFTREARLLRRVSSHDVVSVHDLGELEDGRPYMVMEYANGGALEDRVSARSGIDVDSLVAVIDALAGGMSALHGAGIIHRDIKPSNILISGAPHPGGHASTPPLDRGLGRSERLLIGDLGLAKDQHAERRGPTIVGGTPRYRAPEQGQLGGDITPAADVYAATAVVWFCLTGVDPPLYEELNAQLPTIPEEWQRFFERGLHRDHEDRLSSAAQWRDSALDAVGRVASPRADRAGFDAPEPGSTCPYKGLAAFQPEDSGLFFGRDDLVERLTSRLQSTATLIIGGPSGSGKSSLLRAGLIPAVRRGSIPGSQNWAVALFTPSIDFVEELSYQIGQLSGDGTAPEPSELIASPHLAHRWLPHDRPVLLAIDQFEELFTLVSHDKSSADALAILEGLTSAGDSRVHLAIALRADFYGRAAMHPWLADRINTSQVLVGPMTRSELRQAIERPAEGVGLRFEPGLADTILEDLGSDPGGLPLLGHALMETWLRRRGNTLTLEGYRAAGGVAGAIANRAEETYATLPPSQQLAARALMLRLTTPGEGAADTRRRVNWDDLDSSPDLAAVAARLTDARLLTADDETVEIAHEALLTSWPRLRSWIDESRDDLRMRQRILAAAVEWQSAEENPDLLYRGSALVAASEWAQENDDQLRKVGRRFVEASRTAEAREHEAARDEAARRRRTRRRAVAALATLTVAALIATVAALFALRESRQDERVAAAAVTRSNESFARALAAAAKASASTDPLLATALAVESMARSTPPTAESKDALAFSRVALAGSSGGLTPLAVVQVPEADTLAMHPDATMFAVGDKSGRLLLYDTSTREIIATHQPHDGGIEEAVFDPTGRLLASTGDDGMVSLLNLDDPTAAPQPFADLDSPIGWSVSFSSDGDLLAAATESGEVRVYETATGDRVDSGTITRTGDYLTVTFSDDDQLLLVGRGDGFVEVRRVEDGSLVGEPFEAHPGGNDVWEIVVGDDGRTVITAGADGAINVWDLQTLEKTGEFARTGGAPPSAEGVVVRPGSTEVLVGGDDGFVYRTDLGDEVPRVRERSGLGHEDEIVDGALDAAGGLYATLSDDQTVRLWLIDVMFPTPLEVIATGFGEVSALATAESGTRVAVGSEDGTVVVVDDSGALVTTVAGPTEEVTALVFGDENTVVAGYASGRLIAYDATNGTELAAADAHAGAVLSLTAASNRPTVASGGADGAVRVWNAADLTSVTEGPAHARDSRVALVGDGDSLISVGAGTGRVVSIDGEQKGTDFRAQDVTALAVSPDGETVAVGDSAETVGLLSFTDLGAPPTIVLPRHSGGVAVISFTPDGETIVVLSRTGKVLLWDRSSGLSLGPAHQLPAGSAHLAVDRQGVAWLATAGDGTLRKLTALDVELACRLTAGVLDAARIATFIDDQALRSCGTS